MRIRDIENKEIRELAIKRCKDGCDENTDLDLAFYWKESKEGKDFWDDVNEGDYTIIKEQSRTEQSRIELLEQTLRDVKIQLFDVNKRETVLTIGIQSVLDK